MSSGFAPNIYFMCRWLKQRSELRLLLASAWTLWPRTYRWPPVIVSWWRNPYLCLTVSSHARLFSPHHTSCCHCNLHITSTSQQRVNEERDPKHWFKIFLIYKKYFNFGFLVHESPETAPLIIIQCSSLLSVSKWKVQSSGLCLLSTTQRKGYFNAPKAVEIKPWSYKCLCSRQKEQGAWVTRATCKIKLVSTKMSRGWK